MAAQMKFASARLVPDHFLLLNLTTVQDVTENANWNKCLDVNGMSLARCIYNCDNYGDCENDCVAQFKARTKNCPCEVGRMINYTKVEFWE